MFLDAIYPVGQIGDNANQLRLPPVNFDAIDTVLMPAYLDGRVDYNEAGLGVAAMRLPRNVVVKNGLGGRIEVTYGRQAPCPDGGSNQSGYDLWYDTKPGNWDVNMDDCFPVMHTPPDAPEPGFGIFHKYLVKKVVAKDTVAGSADQVTQYDYSLSTATWANTRSPLVDDWNESWSVWRGYREVRVVSGSGTDPARYTVSRHTQFQGMYHDYYDSGNGGGIKNTAVADYDGNVWDDHFALTGKTLQVRHEKMTAYNSNPSLATYAEDSSRRYEYTYPLVADGPAWWNIHKARLKIDIHRVKLDDGSWREDRTETTYDSYGLPVVVNNYHQIGIGTDNTCTSYTYARRDQNDANGSWYLIDFPERAETWTGDTCGSGTLLARTVNFYDGYTTEGSQSPPDGNVTATRIYRDATNYITANRAVFDDMGRPTSTTDPAGLTTTITYTPNTGWPTGGVQASVGGGFNHNSTVWTSRSTGQPTKTIDANGKTTEIVSDQAGRITEVYLPGQAKSDGVPSLKFSYHYTYNGTTGQPTAASRVLSESLFTTVGGNQYLSSHSYVDGYGRQRETQTPGPNGGRLVTASLYDPRGNIATATAAYYNSSTPGSGLHNGALTSIPSYTTSLYDHANRVVTIHDAGTGSTWRTTATVYHGDSVETLPPTGGTRTIAYHDVRGNTTTLRQYTGASTFQDTVYTYDRLGRLTGVTDPATNTWTYGYDLASNRTTTTDPDAGTTTSSYDTAGRLGSTTDARNQKISLEYDGMSRPIARWSGEVSTGTKLASYTYDTLAKGQLISATRHHAGLNYTTAVTGYTNRYQPTGTAVTIPASAENGALTGTYTTTHTYLAGGALATTSVPAAGGLPAETITEAYNTAGYPTTSSSTQTSYTTTFDYQNDGTPWHSIHGAAGKRVRQTYTVDPKTGRLTTHDLDTENQTTPGTWVDRYATGYTYDLTGNITAIAGTTGTSIDQVECFRYDQLRRMTEAWTQTATTCSTPQRTGADPYRRQWTHDAVGNWLTQTDKNTTDTTWTYQVGAAGAVKPHQVKQVTSTGPLSGPTRTFTYDPAGNTLTRTTDTGTAQTLTWDPEGHLATVTQSGATTSYLYDADGRRLLTRAPDKTTLYLPDGTELELTTTGNTVLGTRHYSNAVRDTTGLKWVISNHQNTSTVQIDAQTLTTARRRAMPYGEARGTQPTGWTGTKGYIGGTKDPTGLTHLGAREYDPTLGRFVSVDPIMDLADPQQWNAYCYSNNNPVTWSDPSGLKSIDEEEERYENAPVYTPPPVETPTPTTTVAKYPGGTTISTVVEGAGAGRICFDGDICGYGYGGSDIRDHNKLIAEYDRLKATGQYGDDLFAHVYMLHLACASTAV